MLPFKVTAVVLCEDIRQEQNNKYFLIGVYNGSIVVQDFPSQMQVCWWLQAWPEKVGKFQIQMRLIKEDDATLLRAELEVEVASIGWLALAIPKVSINVQKEGKLRLQLKSKNEGEWVTVQETIVTKGIVGPASNASPSRRI